MAADGATGRALRVVVLGGGISGLSTALTLRRAGHHVQVVSAHDMQDTTSYIAAAVWFPTAAAPADDVLRWGRRSYAEFASLARQGCPGVIMRESLTLYRGDPETPDWTAAVGEVRAAEPGLLPPGYSHGLRFVVPLVQMPRYLPHLLGQLSEAGVDVEHRRVGELAELVSTDTDVVVNAAGIAAGELAGDRSMYPVRGQLVRVANPGLDMSVRDELHPAGRAYVHPRIDDVICGGTLDVNDWDTAPNAEQTASILTRCADIAPALAGAEPLEVLVGLRPGRPTVRVEAETGLLPVPVIHNYGHGGSGITVAWGCADEVTGLVEQIAG